MGCPSSGTRFAIWKGGATGIGSFPATASFFGSGGAKGGGAGFTDWSRVAMRGLTACFTAATRAARFFSLAATRVPVALSRWNTTTGAVRISRAVFCASWEGGGGPSARTASTTAPAVQTPPSHQNSGPRSRRAGRVSRRSRRRGQSGADWGTASVCRRWPAARRRRGVARRSESISAARSASSARRASSCCRRSASSAPSR